MHVNIDTISPLFSMLVIVALWIGYIIAHRIESSRPRNDRPAELLFAQLLILTLCGLMVVSLHGSGRYIFYPGPGPGYTAQTLALLRYLGDALTAGFTVMALAAVACIVAGIRRSIAKKK